MTSLRSNSLLLINEPPLQLLPALAEIIGLNEAIILQQVHYWISFKHNSNIFEDRKWVYNTYNQWQEQFSFWSRSTIERTITNLERKGVLLSREGERRVKYYSIDYEALNRLFEESSKHKNPAIEGVTSNWGENVSRQNDVTVTSNWGDSHVKMTSPYIDTETTQRLLLERETRAQESYEPVNDAISVFSKNAPLEEEEKILKDRKKGSTLDVNWTLPDKWREWSVQSGMMHEEIDMTEVKFRNYWLSTTKNSVKKDWFLTWQNWCMNEYERKGMRLKVKSAAPAVKPPVAKPMPVKKSADPRIQKWNDLQPLLKDRMGMANYESWLERNFELVEAGEKAVFKVKSNFSRDSILLRFGSDLAAVLEEIDPKLGMEENIEFIVDPG